MVFLLHQLVELSWPTAHSHRAHAWLDTATAPAAWHTTTSLAHALRWVKAFFSAADAAFSLRLVSRSHLDLSHLNVHPPQNGALFRIKFCLLDRSQRALQEYTARRPIRIVNDLARAL